MTTSVLFIVRSLYYGGAERQLVTLARGLLKRGFKIKVAVFYSGGPLEKPLREAGVEICLLQKYGRWDVGHFLYKFIRLIRKNKPDILYSYLDGPNILAALVKPIFGASKIIWGIRASYVDLSKYDWLANIVFHASRWVSDFPDLILVNSNAGKLYYIERGYPKDKITVILNGIDTRLFYNDKVGRGRMREEWEIEDDCLLIGIVGRLDVMKDHVTFIEAASRFLGKGHSQLVQFVCIGDGDPLYLEELRRYATKLGLRRELSWIGARHDMRAVYSALDIVTSTSYGEGFPNVVGEAMACGIPCVVTNVGDSAHIVGDTGMVVSTKNPDAVVRAWWNVIERINTQGRYSIAKVVRDRIVELFDEERLCTETANVIEKGLLAK